MLEKKPLFTLREPRGLDAVTANIRAQLQKPAHEPPVSPVADSFDENRRSAMQSYMKKRGEVSIGY